MLNIVQLYNVFSPLHYTAIFITLELSFFLRLFIGQIRNSELCFRHCCDVHWMDFQPLDNTDALVLWSDLCVSTCNHLTAHIHLHKHTHTQTHTTQTHTHTRTYICIPEFQITFLKQIDVKLFSSFHSCLYEIIIWMCSEETAVRLNTLKVASVEAETRRSEN